MLAQSVDLFDMTSSFMKGAPVQKKKKKIKKPQPQPKTDDPVEIDAVDAAAAPSHAAEEACDADTDCEPVAEADATYSAENQAELLGTSGSEEDTCPFPDIDDGDDPNENAADPTTRALHSRLRNAHGSAPSC